MLEAIVMSDAHGMVQELGGEGATGRKRCVYWAQAQGNPSSRCATEPSDRGSWQGVAPPLFPSLEPDHALRLLEVLARGASEARLTREVIAALARQKARADALK